MKQPHSTNGEEFLRLVINIHSSFPGLSFGRLVDWSVGWPVGQQSVSWFQNTENFFTSYAIISF